MNEQDIQEWKARLEDMQLFLDSRKHDLDMRELNLKQRLDMLDARERVLNDMISQIQKESKE